MTPNATRRLLGSSSWLVRLVLVAVFGSNALGLWMSARAESRPWAIVAVTGRDAPANLQPLVRRLGAELERRRQSVWLPEAAAARFREASSREATVLSKRERDDWVRLSRSALRSLAKGDHGAALERLDVVERLALRAGEELNRDAATSTHVLDACLYLTRALLETGSRRAAEAQVGQCVRRVPGSVPAELMHPPAVLALFQAARAIGQHEAGALSVDSQPSGCLVRANGVPLGRTPFRTEALLVGGYRVQVECDETRGRVHAIQIHRGQSRLFVDGWFERAVRTKPVVHLRYTGPGDAARSSSHAQAIAAVLPAEMVLLVSKPEPAALRLDLVSHGGVRRGCARIATTAEGPRPGAVEEAVADLFRGRCGQLSALVKSPETLSSAGI